MLSRTHRGALELVHFLVQYSGAQLTLVIFHFVSTLLPPRFSDVFYYTFNSIFLFHAERTMNEG